MLRQWRQVCSAYISEDEERGGIQFRVQNSHNTDRWYELTVTGLSSDEYTASGNDAERMRLESLQATDINIHLDGAPSLVPRMVLFQIFEFDTPSRTNGQIIHSFERYWIKKETNEEERCSVSLKPHRFANDCMHGTVILAVTNSAPVPIISYPYCVPDPNLVVISTLTRERFENVNALREHGRNMGLNLTADSGLIIPPGREGVFTMEVARRQSGGTGTDNAEWRAFALCQAPNSGKYRLIDNEATLQVNWSECI